MYIFLYTYFFSQVIFITFVILSQ